MYSESDGPADVDAGDTNNADDPRPSFRLAKHPEGLCEEFINDSCWSLDARSALSESATEKRLLKENENSTMADETEITHSLKIPTWDGRWEEEKLASLQGQDENKPCKNRIGAVVGLE